MPGGRETVATMLLIMRLGILRFFAEARHLVFVLVLVACLPVALAWQISSPMIAAGVAGLILAERWIMDMFDVQGREFVKLSIYPVSWEVVLLGKEVVALLVAVAGGGVAAVVYSWFHPSPPELAEAPHGPVAYLCVLIPVVQAGSSASVAELRKPWHTPFDGIARAAMCLIAAAFSCIPVALLLSLSDSLVPLAIYLGVLCTLWYPLGIRAVAEKIRRWQASPDYIV